MTYHEFGTENKRVVLFIHPSVVMWDYFEYVIPLLEKDFHLIIPALPGYDPDQKEDFTSIEEIAASLVALIGGDMLLGWGTVDESLTGIEQYFSRYLSVSDTRIFWAALLGMIGITIETLCLAELTGRR